MNHYNCPVCFEIPKHDVSFVWTPYLFNIGNKDTGPLFLISGKVDISKGDLSFACYNLWGSELKVCEYYNLELTLHNERTSTQLGWNVHTFTLKEPSHMLKDFPAKTPLTIVNQILMDGDEDDVFFTATITIMDSRNPVKTGYKKLHSDIIPRNWGQSVSKEEAVVAEQSVNYKRYIFIVAAFWLGWYFLG
ncbi:hypothetical protein Ocin01_17060 [Orchesella cincta]|uniref:Uncharacterized protein n=1 Tax=Orchesella cincta TaxID=48709 RepID=A0A1D2M9L5_ORCCI|nr:hypothetical protein Ocin01_17060 [Orchesella cincta]